MEIGVNWKADFNLSRNGAVSLTCSTRYTYHRTLGWPNARSEWWARRLSTYERRSYTISTCLGRDWGFTRGVVRLQPRHRRRVKCYTSSVSKLLLLLIVGEGFLPSSGGGGQNRDPFEMGCDNIVLTHATFFVVDVLVLHFFSRHMCSRQRTAFN